MKSCARAARGGRLDLFLWNMGLAVGDVVAHGVVEEHGFLGDDADLGAQRSEGDVADIVAIDEQTSASHIEEAGNQVDERAFARTAGANDGKISPCRTSRLMSRGTSRFSSPS